MCTRTEAVAQTTEERTNRLIEPMRNGARSRSRYYVDRARVFCGFCGFCGSQLSCSNGPPLDPPWFEVAKKARDPPGRGHLLVATLRTNERGLWRMKAQGEEGTQPGLSQVPARFSRCWRPQTCPTCCPTLSNLILTNLLHIFHNLPPNLHPIVHLSNPTDTDEFPKTRNSLPVTSALM